MQQEVGSSLLMCWEGVVCRDAMRKQYRMEAVMLMMMYDVLTITIIVKIVAANVVIAVATAASAVVDIPETVVVGTLAIGSSDATAGSATMLKTSPRSNKLFRRC